MSYFIYYLILFYFTILTDDIDITHEGNITCAYNNITIRQTTSNYFYSWKFTMKSFLMTDEMLLSCQAQWKLVFVEK